MSAGIAVVLARRQREGQRPIHTAFTYRDEGTIQYLLSNGAEVDDKTRRLAQKFAVSFPE